MHTPTGGSAATMPFVGDASRCAGGGWYYDDPAAPSRILLCPSSCDAVNDGSGGRVDIALGCETVLF
ncbi:hypothetical protein D3C83_251350 [compost metagenome]